MQARYYDPVIGRFYSNDPVGFTGEVDTFNRYSYVANNPYKYTDPNGESKKKLNPSSYLSTQQKRQLADGIIDAINQIFGTGFRNGAQIARDRSIPQNMRSIATQVSNKIPSNFLAQENSKGTGVRLGLLS